MAQTEVSSASVRQGFGSPIACLDSITSTLEADEDLSGEEDKLCFTFLGVFACCIIGTLQKGKSGRGRTCPALHCKASGVIACTAEKRGTNRHINQQMVTAV